MEETINPFLKWAGGKRWLVRSGELVVPRNFMRYVEPFLGGGAVFFHLTPANALLSDLNEDLIRVYSVMRDNPEELWEMMQKHQRKHSKDYYYKIRSGRPDSELHKAGKFLYLNRTCWNGLYRVNLKGDFNVPIGTKQTVVFDGENFLEISKKLANVEFRVSDFARVIDNCIEGDFLFVDPPYTVQHNFNNFLKYNEKIFSWDDQLRLRDSIASAVDRGVMVTITNADHRDIHKLYSGICSYRQVARYSKLSGKSTGRRKTTEALFQANIL